MSNVELFFGINLLRDFVFFPLSFFLFVLPLLLPLVTSIIYGYDWRIVCLKFGILSRLDPDSSLFSLHVSLRCNDAKFQ